VRRILTASLLSLLLLGGGWYAYTKFTRCPGCGELADQRSQWRSAHVTDYSYVYREGGMACCYRVRITVHGRHVTSAEVLQRLPWLDKKPTIDAVFSEARHQMRFADHVTVEYDARYGFPKHVGVDPDRHAIDDEYGFDVEQFQPVRMRR
jgi:hypothetical protein